MKMLKINDLFQKVNTYFPDENISVCISLLTWAKDPEWSQDLKDLLEPCGLDFGSLIHILEAQKSNHSQKDNKIFSQAIGKGIKGEPLAAALLLALAEMPQHPLTQSFVRNGLDLQCLKTSLENIEISQSVLMMVVSEVESKMPTLHQYGRNLTELAKQGDFDDLYPREKELEQLILILMKTQKGNAVITGPAGAGKTALVELFARAIVKGSVPSQLADSSVFEVSISKLLSGTIYRGQFEERIDKLLAELKSNPSAILFVDEMHLLWGAGRTSESAMDASNILKPFLARGEITMIGATTTEEYHRYIAQDKALDRRFEMLPLEAPSGALLLNMVKSMANAFQERTAIIIPDKTVEAAIRLTDQYLPHRSQPDKAINLLDLAVAKTQMIAETQVTEMLLMNLLADQTGQPIAELDDQKQSALLGMEERIKKQIIGQDYAIEKVMQSIIYRRQFTFSGNERNIGTFLFAGPTGVGKTELGRILAREFYGNTDRLLLIDLAEYTHSATLSRLIGAAPGLVGHERPGLIADFLHEHGSGVIIFDEIEKSHSDIRDFLLGILDNGRVRAGNGELMSTRGCIIVVTTNVLTQDDLVSTGMGFVGMKEKKSVTALLKNYFPPEFLGRFDELILFNHLSQNDIKMIIELRLDEILVQFTTQGYEVDFDRDEIVALVLTHLEDHGARSVKRTIEQYFLQPLAVQMLSGKKLHWQAST
ncbi:AAA family ATPase [Pelolinea submarina]|uniref:ATP-dependent Clp protease ATP-binding subunit ClpA n=1 Tax=Pelolinea submarina TaxID=913107 RepID=A0A347ZUB0_9CHLR|nr:ATP-dependent Clp protease ATP-binding subunit [Pelolinea submarina]REG10524.1 ATP-dependent Clp protease ATP-binding subunit ClpA [Pelolinea submarina]BBB48891.1 ATP-dependent Clp protease ATP-binding subunit ClpA [Pelolinea submarina]